MESNKVPNERLDVISIFVEDCEYEYIYKMWYVCIME